MVNYQYGKIYKIVDNTNGNIYIGSTCCPTLARRLAQHRTNYKDYLDNKEYKLYISSYEVMKNNNYEIILLENYPCNSKDELHSRERFYIENHECVNLIIPTRSHKEYYQDNKERIIEHVREYAKNNKELISERSKIYREKHKEEIKERKNAKDTCECGCIVSHNHLSRHRKTKNHIELMKH